MTTGFRSRFRRILSVCFGAFVLGLLAVLILPSEPRVSLLSTARKVSSPVIRASARSGYCWISGNVLLLWAPDGSLHRYDILSNQDRADTNLTLALKGEGVTGPDVIGVKQDWLVAYNYGLSQADRKCRIVSMRDNSAQSASCSAPVAKVFWMPTKLSWLEIPYEPSRSSALRSVASISPQAIDPSFAPYFPIGFIDDYIFLCSTNQTPSFGANSYPKALDVEYWDLREGTGVIKRVKTVDIAHQAIGAAKAAPSGKRIVWECYSKSSIPRVSLSRSPPFIRFKQIYSTKLYVSSDTAESFRLLGEIPDDAPLLPEWTPDSNYVSFVYKDDLFIIKLD